MEKVGFLKKLEKNRVWQLVVFFVLEVLILGIYFVGGKWAKTEVRKDRVAGLTAVEDYRFLSEIENVEVKDGKVEISGWVIFPGVRNKEITLVLNEIGGTGEHVLLGDMTERKDVSHYFFSNEKMDNVGFEVEISEKKLDIEKCYEIFIVLAYEEESDGLVYERERKIKTRYFYYTGDVFMYNPLEFEQPAIEEGDMCRVLENGIVRGYDYENRVWVYQYEQKIYCIVDSSKNSIAEGGDILIPVMPRTTRVDLLPEERQIYGYDHLGVFYADEKYIRQGLELYQVIEVELPTKYPLTYIEMGVYDIVQNAWIKNFMIPMFDWRAYDAK